MCLCVTTACSSHRLTPAEAQRLIENSARFAAPDVLRVRSRYCSSIDAPSDNPVTGLGRLKALESTGAVRVERRATAPGECASTPGPMREWLVLTLTDVGANFHPRALENDAGWEFTLAHRRFVSVGEITFNRDDDPTIAHVLYRWGWHAELIGQLLQVTEEAVNAQATLTRPDGEWMVRDPGF